MHVKDWDRAAELYMRRFWILFWVCVVAGTFILIPCIYIIKSLLGIDLLPGHYGGLM